MKTVNVIILIVLISAFAFPGFGQTAPKGKAGIETLRAEIQKLLKKGDTEKALQILDATKDDKISQNFEFYLLKAEVFLTAKNFEKALDYYQTAFDFEMLSLFTNLNFCKNAYPSPMQNPFMSCDLAFFSYQNLVKLNIKSQQDFINAGQIQNLSPFNLKRSEELDEMLEDILFYRGAAFVQLKKFDEAVESLSIVIRRNPKRLFVYNERAAAFRGLGKNDLAEQDEKQAQETK
jgi:tetratricopeptide (TPR) repeat protein